MLAGLQPLAGLGGAEQFVVEDSLAEVGEVFSAGVEAAATNLYLVIFPSPEQDKE